MTDPGGGPARNRTNPGAAAEEARRLLAQGGQVNRADAALENAVRHENGDIPQVRDVIGATYALLGEYELADSWYRYPPQAQAFLQYAIGKEREDLQ